MTDVFKMKYRVLRVGDNYCPQYKSWWTFGWRNFHYGGKVRSYFDKDYAIEFCRSANTEVIWESEPSVTYGHHTGPE